MRKGKRRDCTRRGTSPDERVSAGRRRSERDGRKNGMGTETGREEEHVEARKGGGTREEGEKGVTS